MLTLPEPSSGMQRLVETHWHMQQNALMLANAVADSGDDSNLVLMCLDLFISSRSSCLDAMTDLERRLQNGEV